MPTEPRDRLLTPALLAFLLAVAAGVGYAVLTRHERPDLERSIALLGDGDLDGDERKIVFDNMLERSSEAASDRHRWAVLLAAVVLQRRDAFATARAELEPLTAHALSAAGMRWLHLGDTVLANVLAAMQAEASADATEARRRWQQVQQQVLLTGDRYAFAGELAHQALR